MWDSHCLVIRVGGKVLGGIKRIETRQCGIHAASLSKDFDGEKEIKMRQCVGFTPPCVSWDLTREEKI